MRETTDRTKTWNPLKRVTPPSYAYGSVNLLEFWVEEFRTNGARLILGMLPAFTRPQATEWVIYGPSWKTRTCDEGEWIILFEIRHYEDSPKWEFGAFVR